MIGFSEIKITPNAIGTPMGGYYTRYSTGIHDNLYARAMYFSNEKEEIIIISVDLVCIYLKFVQRIRNKIFEKTNIKPQNILICSIHNHSGPDTLGIIDFKGIFSHTFNRAIMTDIEKNIVRAAILAKKNAFVGKIGFEKRKIEERIIINRRDPQKDSKYDLGVIRVDSDSGEIMGLMINYACHATTLPRTNTLLTAEFPGYMVQKIKKLTNKSVFSMYTNGACGDINPNLYPENEPFHLITKERISKHSYGEFNNLGNYNKTRKLGFFLAERALEIAKSVKCSEIKDIKIVSETIEIPFQDLRKNNSLKSIINHLSYKFKKFLITNLLNFKRSNLTYLSAIKRGKKWYFRTELQIIKINDILILSIPGELFIEFGLKLISKSSSKNTFIIELSNDWIGYLYPPKEYFLGGYETGLVSFSPVAGIYVFNKMLNLLKKFNKIKEGN